MSEETAERIEAAATAAAAGVAAVENEQAEEHRAESMEAATSTAAEAAEQAAERAEMAAEAASEATEAANQASQQAAVAGDVATEAATEAYSARDDIASLRQEFVGGLQDLRAHIDGYLAKPEESSEPTEVRVTHESATDNPAQSGTNPGGGTGTQGTGDYRPRHRFGRKRG